MHKLLFTECEIRGIDCVFVIDTSGSIGSSRFQMIREFTEGLVQLLTIGLQDSLAGVILFSTDATLHFNLPTHTDIASLSTAINPDLPYDAGSTNTAAALSLLLSSAQDGTMGLRPGHPAIVIVITDGESNVNSAQTIPNAQSVHASNIFQQVYAVGVGNADLTELNAIASDPSLVFNTNSFDSTAIQQLQQTLSQRLCEGELVNILYHIYYSYMVTCLQTMKIIQWLWETLISWFHWCLVINCVTPYKDTQDWSST